MAAIDPNIALGVRPIQIENPMNQYAAMSQIQNAQNQNALAQYQLASAKRGDEKVNFLNQSISKNTNPETGEINYSGVYKDAAQNNFGSLIPELRAKEQETEYKKNQSKKIVSEISKLDFDLGTNIFTQAKEELKQIDPRNPNAAAQFLAWRERQYANPALTDFFKNTNTSKEATEAQIQQAIRTPQGLADTILKSMTSADQFQKILHDKATLAETIRSHKVNESIAGGNLAVSQQRLKAEIDSTGALTPQAIDVAAQIYLQTGQLPALGIGKSAGSLKSAILNRATELYGNPNATTPVKPAGVINQSSSAVNPPVSFNASDMASQIVGNKIDNASKTKAAKDFSTGTQGRQVTAFNTAIDHLATMEKLSDALKNNDVKAFNYLGNLVAKQTGQPAPTNFDAAKQIVTAEVIKAVVASGGGVKERQEAEANFSGANSPAQLKGVINTYKQLLGGQLNSLGLQYETTTGRTDFSKKLTSDAKTEYENIRSKNTTSNTGLPPGVGTDWTLKTDAKGNKAYVSPDNSKFVEVK